MTHLARTLSSADLNLAASELKSQKRDATLAAQTLEASEHERRLLESMNRARDCCGRDMRRAVPAVNASSHLWNKVRHLSERARLIDDALEFQRLNKELEAVAAQLDDASRNCDIELAHSALRRLRRLTAHEPNEANRDDESEKSSRISRELRTFARDLVIRLRLRRPPLPVSRSSIVRRVHMVGRGRPAPPAVVTQTRMKGLLSLVMGMP